MLCPLTFECAKSDSQRYCALTLAFFPLYQTTSSQTGPSQPASPKRSRGLQRTRTWWGEGKRPCEGGTNIDEGGAKTQITPEGSETQIAVAQRGGGGGRREEGREGDSGPKLRSLRGVQNLDRGNWGRRGQNHSTRGGEGKTQITLGRGGSYGGERGKKGEREGGRRPPASALASASDLERWG
ncbi:hypothetical protein TIFTF001_010512 [Ficus carica]|uniref:Uncharacterized protein n=1 Tax=Ficus carica TaxID=3494 RepID=A0AA88D3G2_FICCA|nr:hypothetical protein TIFTF001_010512 [Ficus carica]